jgi:hypothetical protein
MSLSGGRRDGAAGNAPTSETAGPIVRGEDLKPHDSYELKHQLKESFDV